MYCGFQIMLADKLVSDYKVHKTVSGPCLIAVFFMCDEGPFAYINRVSVGEWIKLAQVLAQMSRIFVIARSNFQIIYQGVIFDMCQLLAQDDLKCLDILNICNKFSDYNNR